MSETEHPLSPPRGMRDFYPEEMRLRDTIFDAWSQSARVHAFQHYDACVVESLGLLKRKAGEEITDQLYHFQDKSGRELALRAEMTPTLARMIAARQGSLTFPLRWYAIAQCFRYERMTRGRKREHYQWNMDIIGEKSMTAEVEILAAAAHALAALGLDADRVKIHYNSRGLLADLFSSCQISPEHHAAVYLALDKRGKISDEEIHTLLREQNLTDEQIRRTFELLALQSLEDVQKTLGTETESLRDLLNFQTLAVTAGIAPWLQFSLSVIRGLSYYTGMVFEAFDVDRKFRAIFGGGRYDRLLSDLGGAPTPAVGLGFGDVVIAELLDELGLTQRLIVAGNETLGIGYMELGQQTAALRLASALRAAGHRIDLGLGAERAKHFFGRCDKAGFKRAIFLGPDDIQAGTYRLKELATRTERPLSLTDPTKGL